MNFYDAINAHVAWKTRLLRCIDEHNPEGLDPLTVGRNDQCLLGKWIHGEGARYRNLVLFAKMVEEHDRFHRFAAEVVHHCQNGDADTARGLLASDYARLSHDITRILTRLALELKPGAGHDRETR